MFLLRVGEIIVAFANFRGVYIKGCKDALKNAEIVELKNSTNFWYGRKYLKMCKQDLPFCEISYYIERLENN